MRITYDKEADAASIYLAPIGQLKPLPLSQGKGGLRKGIDGRSNKSLFDAPDR